MAMAEECMGIFERRKLSTIGLVEQDLSCSSTTEGEPAKVALSDAVGVWADQEADSEDRFRLFMVYLIHTAGVRPDDMKKLMEHCKFNPEDLEMLANLEQFGVPVYKVWRCF